jgi:hypothetical protein
MARALVRAWHGSGTCRGTDDSPMSSWRITGSRTCCVVCMHHVYQSVPQHSRERRATRGPTSVEIPTPNPTNISTSLLRAEDRECEFRERGGGYSGDLGPRLAREDVSVRGCVGVGEDV